MFFSVIILNGSALLCSIFLSSLFFDHFTPDPDQSTPEVACAINFSMWMGFGGGGGGGQAVFRKFYRYFFSLTLFLLAFPAAGKFFKKQFKKAFLGFFGKI